MTGCAAWTVLREGVVDALRDRRTLMVVLLSSVLMGPLVLVALSALVASLESRAERREVVRRRRRARADAGQLPRSARASR